MSKTSQRRRSWAQTKQKVYEKGFNDYVIGNIYGMLWSGHYYRNKTLLNQYRLGWKRAGKLSPEALKDLRNPVIESLTRRS